MEKRRVQQSGRAREREADVARASDSQLNRANRDAEDAASPGKNSDREGEGDSEIANFGNAINGSFTSRRGMLRKLGGMALGAAAAGIVRPTTAHTADVASPAADVNEPITPMLPWNEIYIATQAELDLLESAAIPPGTKIHFSPGSYVLSKTLLLPSDCIVEGAGDITELRAEFKIQSAYPSIIANSAMTSATGYDGNRNIVVRNLRITAPAGDGIAMGHCSNVLVENVTSGGFFSHFIDFVAVRNGVVNRLHYPDGTGTAAVQFDQAQNLAAAIFDGTSIISINPDGTPCDHVSLKDSYITMRGSGNSAVWIHRKGNKNISIVDCYLAGGDQQIYSDKLSWTNLLIENCTLQSTSGRAILLRGATGAPAKYLKLNNLQIRGTCWYRPIEINDVDHVSLVNCFVEYSATSPASGGICFPAGTRSGTISNCHVINLVPPQSQANTQSAIKIAGSIYFTVRDCILENHYTGLEAQNGSQVQWRGVKFLNCSPNTVLGPGFVPDVGS